MTWLAALSDAVETWRLRDPIYSALRRAVDAFGRDIERLPYTQLRDHAEQCFATMQAGDLEVYMVVECFETKSNGDLGICIDASTRAGRGRIQPSYRFFKRPNGEVCY